MGKLHELIAVEPDVTSEAQKVCDEAKALFDKRQHFTGSTRTVKMFADERRQEDGVEHKALDTTVDAKLRYIHGAVIRALDLFAQKETTNAEAKADLVVDDAVLVKNMPATALLGLETRLKQLREVYAAIPTLAPGIEWQFDEQLGAYRMVHPEVRGKTEKELRFKEVSPATDKHPAQVEKWWADAPVGRITTDEVSGMLSPAQKSVLLGRIDKLIRAAKQARQRANCQEVVKVQIGKTLIDFIHQQ